MNSLTIAKHVVFKYINAGRVIANNRLQMILYILQGYSLAMNGMALYPNPIYLWNDGPAIPEAYVKDSAIMDMAEDCYDEVDDNIVLLVNTVVNATMQYSDDDLIAICMQTLPIQFTKIGFVIDNDKMKYFFQGNDILSISDKLLMI